MSIRRPFQARFFALGLVFTAGCEENKPAPKPAEHADSGAPRPSSRVDKNIVEALQAEGTKAASQGPPDNGVFAPGAADKEMKIGDPPKLALGLRGSAPAVQFVAPGARLSKKLDGKVEVAIQTGPRSALPTVELALSTETAEKPAAEPGAPPAPTELIVKVMGSKLAADQPGDLPPEAAKMMSKARGSRIKFEVMPTGAGHVTGVEPAKEADESLSLVVRAASDTLAFAFLPYPTDPVGVGAFWMVTSRETYSGLDVVVYRMVKVAEVKPDRALLDVSVKRFTAGGQIAIPGLPAHRVDELASTTTGRLEVLLADTSQVHAELTDMLGAKLAPTDPKIQAQAQGQLIPFQLQVRSRLALGR